MTDGDWKSRKVVIVGAGAVGSTFAFALSQAGIAEEIAIVDAQRRQAEGQVMDLAHGLPFVPPVRIYAGAVSDYKDAGVIVITAGAKQRPGESRLDLFQHNVGIIEQITEEIVNQASRGVIVVVSNPVDVLTYVALKKSGWDKSRVIGSGTVLDSARFRYLLSQYCGVDVRNVHAYILGEHGDSEVPAWSMTHIAGMPIDEYCRVYGRCSDWKEDLTRIAEEVKDSAYHIIDYKGATYFAIGLVLVRIVGAILRNEKSVLTVSTLLEGEYGLKDVCLSLPCVVSQKGVERLMASELTKKETDMLRHSAAILRGMIEQLRL